MLAALDLEPLSEAVYQLFLDGSCWSAEEIGERLDLAPDDVGEALEQLAAARLLTAPGNGSAGYRATDRSAGLPRLVARWEAELERQRRKVAAARDAISTFTTNPGRPGAGPGGHELLERVPGPDAAARRIAELAAGARRRVQSLVPKEAQAHLGPEHLRRVDDALLARGVSVARVLQDSVRADPVARRQPAGLTAAGGRVRTVPALPVLLVLVDGQTALLAADPADPAAGVVQLRGPGVVAALRQLFDSYWREGTDWGGSPVVDRNELTPTEQELLRLLAVGHTDAQISRRLGVSARTVRRMYAGITERLAVRSRFEAGVVAAQRGWV
ncbi:helix-turn-helix transcriptional regulator [Streptomyces aculeolatus]